MDIFVIVVENTLLHATTIRRTERAGFTWSVGKLVKADIKYIYFYHLQNEQINANLQFDFCHSDLLIISFQINSSCIIIFKLWNI